MKTGYARCSTNESKQDIERQVRELKQAGAERVFLEYEHGAFCGAQRQLVRWPTAAERR